MNQHCMASSSLQHGQSCFGGREGGAEECISCMHGSIEDSLPMQKVQGMLAVPRGALGSPQSVPCSS